MIAEFFPGPTERIPYRPLHPGDHLIEYLELNRMTVAEFGRYVGVNSDEIQYLVERQAALTPTMARLLGLATGMESADWLELQYMWDGWFARNHRGCDSASGLNPPDDPPSQQLSG